MTEPSIPATAELSQAVGPASSLPGKDMVWVPGGTFAMGAADFYEEERPVHRVDGFWIDKQLRSRSRA